MKRKDIRYHGGYAYVLDPITGDYRTKSSVEWEKAHPGEVVGKHERVLFLDGDKTNFSPDNLFKVNNRVLIAVNKMRRKSDNIETVQLIAQIAQMKVQSNDTQRNLGVCDPVERMLDSRRNLERIHRMKAEHPEKYEAYLQYRREWRRRMEAEHPEKRMERIQRKIEWDKRHKDHIAAYGRAYRARHKAERQRQEAAHAD